MSVSVCLSVSVCACLCVCLSAIISSELHVRSSPNFLRTLPMAVARSSSGGVAIRYVLPVLLITSSSLTSQGWSRRRRPAEAQRTRSIGLGYKLCAVIPAAGHQTHGTTFRTLKGTSQVAATGAESAVCDWLVDVCGARAGSLKKLLIFKVDQNQLVCLTPTIGKSVLRLSATNTLRLQLARQLFCYTGRVTSLACYGLVRFVSSCPVTLRVRSWEKFV